MIRVTVSGSAPEQTGVYSDKYVDTCMVCQVDDMKAPRRRRNRRGQGALLRNELIAAARQLLITAESESDLSIRAVTRAAGAAPQSFYLQFADLNELLYALYAIEYDHLRQAMAQAAATAPDPVGRLRAVAWAYCDYAQAHPGRYRILTGVRGQAHPEWAALPGRPAFTVIADTAAAALAGNHPDADPFVAASMIWACLHGIVALRADRPAFPWPPLADMIDSLIRQILTTPPGSQPSHPRPHSRTPGPTPSPPEGRRTARPVRRSPGHGAGGGLTLEH